MKHILANLSLILILIVMSINVRKTFNIILISLIGIGVIIVMFVGSFTILELTLDNNDRVVNKILYTKPRVDTIKTNAYNKGRLDAISYIDSLYIISPKNK